MTLCRHFGICGGCALQNLSPEDYRAAKRETVMDALARRGLAMSRWKSRCMVPLQIPPPRRVQIRQEKAAVSRSAFMPPAATPSSTCANAWC